MYFLDENKKGATRSYVMCVHKDLITHRFIKFIKENHPIISQTS